MNGVIPHDSLTVAAMTSSWFAAGSLIGLVHFRSLRWTVQRMLDGRAMLSTGLQVVRLAAIGTVLTLVARWFGALPLLVGLLGLLATRTALLISETQR